MLPVHRHRRLSIRCAIIFIVLLSSAACQEAPPPFGSADRRPITESPRRLTYNTGDDRSPVWLPSGDSVMYVAEGFGNLPISNGVLVSLSRTGGAIRALLPELQTHASLQRWLMAPIPSPDGQRIAYVQMWVVFSRELCGTDGSTLSCSDSAKAAPSPRLSEIRIRIRKFGATGPVSQDPVLSVSMKGRVWTGTNPPHYIINVFPFQKVFLESSAPVFRPSWGPTGERLVFSNGLRLRIWTVGEDSAETITGTRDGVWPAWSPDGQWIAFTHLVRSDSTGTFCRVTNPFTLCSQERTEYTIGDHILTMIRPDGSERIELGLGNEPAWGPESETLYFRRDSTIWRIRVPDGAPVPVSGTRDGREPSVSPDGDFLAFARLTEDGDHNIWVVALEGES